MPRLIGLDPTSVSAKPLFRLGQIGTHLSTDYVYVRAAGAVPGRGAVVLIDALNQAAALSTANDAPGGRIGVAQAAAQDDDYFWAAVRGATDVHVGSGYVANAELHATATPGTVDDAATGPAITGLTGSENTFGADGVVVGWASFPVLAPAVAAGGPTQVAAANVTGVGGEANLSVWSDKVDDRLDEGEEQDAGLRHTIQIVSGADLTPAIALAAYRIPGASALPAASPDSHITLSVGGTAAEEQDFTPLTELPAASQGDPLNNGNSIHSTIGSRGFRIAREAGTNRPLLGADSVDPVSDIGISVSELVVENYARKDSTAAVPASRLADGSIPREKLNQATQNAIENAVPVDGVTVSGNDLVLSSTGGHSHSVTLPAPGAGGQALADDSVTPRLTRFSAGTRVAGRVVTIGPQGDVYVGRVIEGVKVLFDGVGPGRMIAAGNASYVTPFTLLDPAFDLDDQTDGIVQVELTTTISQQSVSTIGVKTTDIHAVGHVSIAALKAMAVRDASTPTIFEGLRVLGAQIDDTAKGTTELARRIGLLNFWFAKDTQARLGYETITDGLDSDATRYYTIGTHLRIILIGSALASVTGGSSIPDPAAGDVGSFWGARGVGDQAWVALPDVVHDGSLYGGGKVGRELGVPQAIRYSDAKADARARAAFRDLLQDTIATKMSAFALSGDRTVKRIADLNLQFTIDGTTFDIGAVQREEGSDHRLSIDLTPVGQRSKLNGYVFGIGSARYHFDAARYEQGTSAPGDVDDFSWANAADPGTNAIEASVYEPLDANNFLPGGGTEGQVPKKQAGGGVAWEDESGGGGSAITRSTLLARRALSVPLTIPASDNTALRTALAAAPRGSRIIAYFDDAAGGSSHGSSESWWPGGGLTAETDTIRLVVARLQGAQAATEYVLQIGAAGSTGSISRGGPASGWDNITLLLESPAAGTALDTATIDARINVLRPNAASPRAVNYEPDSDLTRTEDDGLTTGGVVITRDDLQAKRVEDADEATNQITLLTAGANKDNAALSGYGRADGIGSVQSATWVSAIWIAAAAAPPATGLILHIDQPDSYPQTIYMYDGTNAATLARQSDGRYTSTSVLARVAGTVYTFFTDSARSTALQVSPAHKLEAAAAAAGGASVASYVPAADVSATLAEDTWSAWLDVAESDALTAAKPVILLGKLNGVFSKAIGGGSRGWIHGRLLRHRSGADTEIGEAYAYVRNAANFGTNTNLISRYGTVVVTDMNMGQTGDTYKLQVRAICQDTDDPSVTSINFSTAVNKLEMIQLG